MTASTSLLGQTLRRLRRERGFTLTVLLTLALCIGANVAMFAVIDAVLLRSFPFEHGDRLATMLNSYPGAGAPRIGASVTNYYERRGALESFDSVSMWQGGSAIIGEAGSPQRVERDRVSPEFFETIGFPLAMGQMFTDEEMVYANSSVAVITHGFWQDYFDGDMDVLGRDFVVDSLPVRVVGVLNPGFRYLNSEAKFYVPLASDLEDREMNRRHSNNVRMIGRLKAGVSIDAAQAEMTRFNEAQMERDPYAEMVKGAGFETFVVMLRGELVRDSKPILLILQAGAFSLLLIGCVNLANLMLIRAKGRAKETAVRQSLGAGKRALTREAMLETVTLSLLGGALGLGVGAIGIRLLGTLGVQSLPLGSTISMNGQVALVSLVGSVLVGMALAIPIVLVNTRRDLAPTLQSESRTGTVSKGAQLVRSVFIVLQIGLAFALLAGAGLLGMSLQKALSKSPGFRTDQVLTGTISLPWKNYPEDENRQAFLKRLYEELRNQPGVKTVGLSDALPFLGNISNNATVVEGIEIKPGDSIRAHYTGFGLGDYWQALGIPLMEGRYLEMADEQSDNRVCLVDTSFAKRYWPEGGALGKRIAMDVVFNEEEAMTIVGVVGTIKQNDLTEDGDQGTVYMPYSIRGSRYFGIALKTEIAPEAMGNTLREIVLGIDPELPVDGIRVMQDRIDDSLLVRRSPAILAGIFAGVALLLASIGTYGVLAYAVGERRREIGVRLAIGASPGEVLRQFILMGGKLLAIGTVLGVAGSWLSGVGMKSVLFEVVPYHFGVLAVTGVVMAMVVLSSTYLPSRRAARVSPLEAMRED